MAYFWHKVQVQVKFIITHARVNIISAVSKYIKTVTTTYKYIKYISILHIYQTTKYIATDIPYKQSWRFKSTVT